MTRTAVIGLTAAAFLAGFGIVMWAHAGAAVYLEIAVNGLLNCF
ncbi:MAG: hypothetical protein ROR55_14385 [Devosia sp.]